MLPLFFMQAALRQGRFVYNIINFSYNNLVRARKIMDLEKMHDSAASVSDLLKLLGHPDRLMVLCQLKFGEQSVGELARNLNF